VISSALVELRLTRFRSHTASTLELQAKPVVLFGPNGAGKTNILDAISLLAPGRGLRRAPYLQAVQRGCDEPWAIFAKLQHPDGQFDLGTGLEITTGGSRRLVRIDGASATAGALARLLRQVWLIPAQDRVFSGARGLRLKYYDRLVFSLFPDHGRASNAYDKALRGRQRLLDEGGADPAWLQGLEQQMAENGAKLIQNRLETCTRLTFEIEARNDSAFPKALLALEGEDELAIGSAREDEDLIELLQAGFAACRMRDSRAGRTLGGPHRADLAVRWQTKDMPAGECSTGEQKALLVGMALAHARAVTAAADTPPPLILLDEACAHLDEARRAALIEELCALQGQARLTGTDRSLFDAFGDRAQYFAVSEDGVSLAG
jgi:DNA replication and repair protein RecF